MKKMRIKRAALIGIGAVGAVYGKLLHECYGPDFFILAGGSRRDRLKNNGVALNREIFFPAIVSPEEKQEAADLILIGVKNNQLEQALEDIKNSVGPETIILPLLNGITATDRIKKVYPLNTVFLGLSMGIDAIRTEEGVENTNDGFIQFGETNNTELSEEVKAADRYLRKAGVATDVTPDMVRAVWKKWLLNVAVNQVSALTGATFGELVQIAENKTLCQKAMLEVLSLAEAAGINLTFQDVADQQKVIEKAYPLGKTSMLQDVEAGRITEVEQFSGTVIALGEKFNVPTPVNQVFYQLIKSKEKMNSFS